MHDMHNCFLDGKERHMKKAPEYPVHQHRGVDVGPVGVSVRGYGLKELRRNNQAQSDALRLNQQGNVGNSKDYPPGN